LLGYPRPPLPTNGIGSGTVATIPGTEVNTPGEYRATFTLTANRRCPPNPKVVTSDPATAIVGDLDIDSDNSNGTGAPDRTTPEDDAEMTAPGKVICTNVDDDDADGSEDRNQEPPPAGDDDLVPMVAEILGGMSQGRARLQYDETRIQVYDTDRATIVNSGQYTSLPMTPNPKTFWVEGVATTSGATTICTFEIDHDSDGSPDCADSVAMTVCDVQKVPLGGSVAASCEAECFRVYVPTKWGGVVNIQTTGGTITDLKYPDRTPYTNNTETGENRHGWYTFRVAGASSYTVSASFTQIGQAAKRPWNFYWWSTDPPEINLYEDSGQYQPLAKYDARHGTTARDWEAANHNTPVTWCGHCLGASIASIVLAQPTPVAGSTYNAEEIEGLWAELGENVNHTFQDAVGPVPAGPPVAGDDGTDEFAPEFQRVLEEHVKGNGTALYAQLRSDGGAAGEVWNHAVFRFLATFEEAPGGDEKVVRINNVVWANDDHTPPTNDLTTRTPEYAYVITYGANGIPDGTSPGVTTDWISVGGEADFAPAWLAVISRASWAANNPNVSEANVRADDSAN